MAAGSDTVTGDGEPPRPLETLGVAEIVVTILEARKTMPWATAASVSRERRGDLVHVRVALLESSPPPAATQREGQPGQGTVVADFTVRRLGEDLAVAFGQKDVIILR